MVKEGGTEALFVVKWNELLCQKTAALFSFCLTNEPYTDEKLLSWIKRRSINIVCDIFFLFHLSVPNKQHKYIINCEK